MIQMRVEIIPVLSDNYAYLVIDEATNRAALIDPSEADPPLAAIARAGVKLAAILNTHHHWDHTGGNEAIAAAHPGVEIIGYEEDRARIPGITRGVRAGETVEIGGLKGSTLFVPCHTRGHVAYLFGRALFSGDTLFAAGCGRFFEGTAKEMYRALHEVIGVLPDETLLYCGHEYTEKNLRFAQTLEPSNQAISDKLRDVISCRAQNTPTIPTTLGEERTYNPFLRTTSPELIESVSKSIPKVDTHDPVQVLAGVRELKDRF
jgi:hydroxyacylglutathione hydrolase